MTIDELLSLAGLTANDEIPVWDAEATDEPTKKITAQNLAASVKALAGLVGEAEFTEALADKASAIVDTASGAVASFPDGAAVAAKDVTISIDPVQAGSGDPSPTNVRPISGWTGANVTRAGKNLYKVLATTTTISGITFTVKEDGQIIANGTSSQSRLTLGNQVFPAGSYILSGTPPTGSSTTYRLLIYNQTSRAYQAFDNNSGASFTLNEPSELSFLIDVAAGVTINNVVFKPMICLSTASNPDYAHFEPYTGTTIPISWQSVAGTVYGGTLDVTTGLLTVTMAEVDLGTLNWQYSATDRRFITTMASVLNTPEYFGLICSRYSTYKSGGWESQPDKSIADAHAVHFTSIVGRLLVHDTAYTDAATFKAAMSGVQLVYELATPQTYQLTPTEMEMLLGDNNVWADTGDSTVTYRADTKLYIQKINAPTDDDMIADAQIASGKYFIVGGNLYRSTTTIPAGDAINPGSNCIMTNLADALNALNT